MPKQMCVASEKQREFFAALSKIDLLVLGMKNLPDVEQPRELKDWPSSDSVSINAHGRFFLFDKYWPEAKDRRHETLIAFSPSNKCELTDTGEPLVHFHVDWRQIKWANVDQPARTLIGADHQIVLSARQDLKWRCIWFYYSKPAAIAPLRKFADGWVDLQPLQ